MKKEPIDKYLSFLRNGCKEVLAREFKGKEIFKPTMEEVRRTAAIFKIFSNTTKLMITWILLQNSMPVCLISAILGANRSLVSHYLRELREYNIVYEETKGKFKYYSINPRLKSLLKDILTKVFKA